MIDHLKWVSSEILLLDVLNQMRDLLLFTLLEVNGLKGMLGSHFHRSCVEGRDHNPILRLFFGRHHLLEININFLELPLSLHAGHHEQLVPPKLQISDAFSIVKLELAGNDLQLAVYEISVSFGVYYQCFVVRYPDRVHGLRAYFVILLRKG